MAGIQGLGGGCCCVGRSGQIRIVARVKGCGVGGASLGGVPVSVLDPSGHEVGSGVTNAAGTYEFSGTSLPRGDYTVRATPPSGFKDNSNVAVVWVDNDVATAVSLTLCPLTTQMTVNVSWGSEPDCGADGTTVSWGGDDSGSATAHGDFWAATAVPTVRIPGDGHRCFSMLTGSNCMFYVGVGGSASPEFAATACGYPITVGAGADCKSTCPEPRSLTAHGALCIRVACGDRAIPGLDQTVYPFGSYGPSTYGYTCLMPGSGSSYLVSVSGSGWTPVSANSPVVQAGGEVEMTVEVQSLTLCVTTFGEDLAGRICVDALGSPVEIPAVVSIRNAQGAYVGTGTNWCSNVPSLGDYSLTASLAGYGAVGPVVAHVGGCSATRLDMVLRRATYTVTVFALAPCLGAGGTPITYYGSTVKVTQSVDGTQLTRSTDVYSKAIFTLVPPSDVESWDLAVEITPALYQGKDWLEPATGTIHVDRASLSGCNPSITWSVTLTPKSPPVLGCCTGCASAFPTTIDVSDDFYRGQMVPFRLEYQYPGGIWSASYTSDSPDSFCSDPCDNGFSSLSLVVTVKLACSGSGIAGVDYLAAWTWACVGGGTGSATAVGRANITYSICSRTNDGRMYPIQWSELPIGCTDPGPVLPTTFSIVGLG